MLTSTVSLLNGKLDQNMSRLQAPAIGIWGLGIVGWSVLRYLTRLRQLEHSGQIVGAAWPAVVPITATIVVCEQRALTALELAQLQTLGVQVTADVAQFLQQCYRIIPSPGVDLHPYQAHQVKFLSELDLFYAGFSQPILAVTGSLGKTTITTMISELLTKLGYRVCVGGNIGVGMCDLIEQQADLDLAVLELSSFQLEAAQQLRAQWALWTNFYPNHLDRHADLTAYFAAKLQLILNQQAVDIGILPADLCTTALSTLKQVSATAVNNASVRHDAQLAAEVPGVKLTGSNHLASQLSCFSLARPTHLMSAGQLVAPLQGAYYVHDQVIVREQGGVITPLVTWAQLSAQTMLINWVAIVALLDRLVVDSRLKQLGTQNWPTMLVTYQFGGVPHRLELCQEGQGVKFYNDSKSTVPEATLAALASLRAQPVIL